MNDENKKHTFYVENLERETALIAYLDLTNMFHWQKILKWNFRVEDVVSELYKIKSIKEVKIYYGLNERDKNTSHAFHRRIRKSGAVLKTKPVKFIRKSIDEALLFKKSTRSLFNETINEKMRPLIEELQKFGTFVEEPKCNFDVEIAMDIMDDVEKVSGIVLFSGDSDLAGPLERIKLKGKKIYIVGVRNMTAGELHIVKNVYIDFGKFYNGKRNYIKSENPALGGTA